ncbi:MAG: metallophosphoesterase [bacterium]
MFIFIALAIYLIVHAYIFISLKTGLSLSRTSSFYLAGTLLLLALLYPLSRFLGRPEILTYLGSIWLGVMAISVTVFLLQDIVSALLPANKEQITYTALFLVVLISVYSFINESKTKIKEVTLPTTERTTAFKGMTVVQLSDLHLGIIKNEHWLNELVEKVNSLNPDIIVITGDILDDRAMFDEKYSNVLKQLKSKYGIFACLGNHEYYAGKDRAIKFISNSNIKLLINSSALVNNKIYIVGVDDKQGLSFGSEGPDIEKAMTSVDRNKYTILLSHNPSYYKVASSFAVDLMLSGHVHAGQIPPIEFLVTFIYKHSYGLYKNGKGLAYTTSGTGTWGPPMRFLNSSEIVKFTFR